MSFSWTIFLCVFAVNLLCVLFMRLCQDLDKSLPPRHSVIPGTKQRFNYMQDFYTAWWGDLIGVPLIANAFVHLVANGYIGWVQWAIFVVLAVLLAVGFLNMCLSKDHKPDQGFPEIGKVSWHGLSHLPYLGCGYTLSLFTIGHLVAGHIWGPVLYVALLGGAFYIATFIADIKTGNFEPLKRQQMV